jgi:ClpP class serine protease
VDSLFTGEVWNGKKAVELGLTDGIGTPFSVLGEKIGPYQLVSVVKHSFADKISALRGQGSMSLSATSILEAVEDRFMLSRFGI